MKQVLIKLGLLSVFFILSNASAQVFQPLGDSGVFCFIGSGSNRLVQLKLGGYEVVSKAGVVNRISRKLSRKKEKKSRLVSSLSETSNPVARQRIKNKIEAVKNEIAALKLDKQRVNDCLGGVSLPAGASPIKIASKQTSSNQWSAWAYIDPRPIRVNLPGGGFSTFGAFGSLWCLTYNGSFSDNSLPPWPAGTEFSAYKDFDLCDPALNAPAGACMDFYGGNNAGIPVLLKTGASEEEARANVSAFLGSVSYLARIQRASTCEGDKTSL